MGEHNCVRESARLVFFGHLSSSMPTGCSSVYRQYIIGKGRGVLARVRSEAVYGSEL